MGDGFYRVSLIPNPGDSTMYIWDEAATVTGYPAWQVGPRPTMPGHSPTIRALIC
jgi:hypothetical protein